jgi:hypothetical protein
VRVEQAGQGDLRHARQAGQYIDVMYICRYVGTTGGETSGKEHWPFNVNWDLLCMF